MTGNFPQRFHDRTTQEIPTAGSGKFSTWSSPLLNKGIKRTRPSASLRRAQPSVMEQFNIRSSRVTEMQCVPADIRLYLD